MLRPDRKAIWKRNLFRLAAILLGLLPFVTLEAVLRLAGLGEPTEALHPIVGFEAIHPLFELDEKAHRYQIAESRQVHFRRDSFAATKAPDEFRIFCLGGSTVQGRPYRIETSFSTWLELSLRAAEPNRKWEVVNCGGVSYASYRLVPILRELLKYEPDLLVVYTGHNEFLEARTYEGLREKGAATRLVRWLTQLRTYNWLVSALNRRADLEEAKSKEVLAAEVDALLDYQGGLADYHRNNAWREGAIQSFERHLREMIRLAVNADIPILFLEPIANLKDCPPFKSTNSAHLTGEERAAFQTLWKQAKSSRDADKQIQLLERAVEIDKRHAAAHFLLGRAYLKEKRIQDARTQFVRAKDEDICPLRMPEPLCGSLQRVAEESGTPLLELRRLFAEKSQAGIPGDELLLDHVHPSITGHQLIAEQIFRYLESTGVVAAGENWQHRQQASYREHLGSLDAVYYAKGKQRLKGLIRWTQGRANKLREKGARPSQIDSKQ